MLSAFAAEKCSVSFLPQFANYNSGKFSNVETVQIFARPVIGFKLFSSKKCARNQVFGVFRPDVRCSSYSSNLFFPFLPGTTVKTER